MAEVGMRTDPLWLGGRGATVPQCPGFRAHFRRPLRLAGRRFLIGPEHTTGTSPFHRHYLPPSALFDLLLWARVKASVPVQGDPMSGQPPSCSTIRTQTTAAAIAALEAQFPWLRGKA